MLVARCGDGRSPWTSQLQCPQQPPTAGIHLHLQLLLPLRFPGRPRRPAVAPLPCRLRLLEIRQGVGTLAQQKDAWTVELTDPSVAHLRAALPLQACNPV